MLRMLVCMQFCKETEQYRDIHKERERERERAARHDNVGLRL